MFRTVIYSIVVAMTFGLVTSCTNLMLRKTNVSKAQLYLQKVNNSNPPTNDYGYSAEHPIVLKLSNEYGGSNIIVEYLNRLMGYKTTGPEIHQGDFKIVEESKISMANNSTKETSNFDQQEYWIYVYKLTSTDKNFEQTLYFTLNKKSKEFYVPKGLAYSYLAG